jgi:hypothetical protein
MDTMPRPEPLNVRKERQASEGKEAWKAYRAQEEAVNKNMERALRLARDAEPARKKKKASASTAKRERTG